MFSKLFRAAVIAVCFSHVLAKVKMVGVNISGFDFGCTTLGFCPREGITPPLQYRKDRNISQDIRREQYFQDGPAQMNHFTDDLGFNVYRLPVAWQFLVNHQLGGKLDQNNWAFYDELVQACLKTGSHCIIDIHNYARWNTMIIGRHAGCTNEDFASLWGQLATKYAKEPRVMMGLMNEPHDVDMNVWATTVQAAVTAIRQAGAVQHTILLPGTNYTSTNGFWNFSAPALSRVTNLDKSTTNLVYEVHRYFDPGNKPESKCRGNLIDEFAPLATYLRKQKRQALVAETGGGGYKQECMPFVRQGLQFLNDNSDVFTGIVGWGAGAFSSTRYPLSLSPKWSTTAGYIDQPFITQALLPIWNRTSSDPVIQTT